MVGIKKSLPNALDWLFYSRNVVIDHNGLGIQSVSAGDQVVRLKPLSWYRSIKGWYMLEVNNRGTERINGVVIACARKSPDVEQRLTFSCKSGGTFKRVVYFAHQTDFYLDCEQLGCVNEGAKFSLVKLSRSFAKSRMQRKASAPEYLSLRDLYDMYSSLFDSYDEPNEYEIWKRLIEPRLWAPLVSPMDRIEVVKVSIVMPVYNPNVEHLKRAIESVFAQTNQSWELIIADDCSTDLEVVQLLEQLPGKDSRVKLVRRTSNGHISAASNSCIDHVSGDYVALFDHDDELSPHAINEIIHVIVNRPDIKLIYSDEDKLDISGNRVDAHFKPDFSPETLLHQNYVSHLTVLHIDLIKQVGGFRAGVEGSQDHDLLLRCLPYLDQANVVHIPKVLYHWRMALGSTAMRAGEKTYTWDAGVKSVRDYLSLNEPVSGCEVTYGLRPNTVRIKPGLIKERVSIIIPTRNRLDLLRVCIDSILSKTTYANYEIIVVDNNSDDPKTLRYMQGLSDQSVIKLVHAPIEFNYSKINNLAVEQASGSLICLLNNDTEIVSENWLDELAMWAVRPEIGCVGARLLYPDRTLQHGGVIVGLGGVAGHSHLGLLDHQSGYFDRMAIVNNVSAVTAACLMVKKSVYKQVGGLDESLKVAFNDIDFCLRVSEQGLRNLWTPYAELYHYESASRGYEVTPEKRERFKAETEQMQERWGDRLKYDPFYNPNFDLYKESYKLRLSINA